MKPMSTSWPLSLVSGTHVSASEIRAIPNHRDGFRRCPIRMNLKSFADNPGREFVWCQCAVSVSGSVFAHVLWTWLLERVRTFSHSFISLRNTGLPLWSQSRQEGALLALLLLCGPGVTCQCMLRLPRSHTSSHSAVRHCG